MPLAISFATSGALLTSVSPLTTLLVSGLYWDMRMQTGEDVWPLDARLLGTCSMFKTFGGPVAWSSRRQPTTALSTTEAEYMASSDATRQAIWLRLLLKNLGFSDSSPLPILNDNNAAIQLSRNPVHHDRSTHIDMRYHFLRKKVLDNTIELSHVASEDNLADLLTKPLASEQFTSPRDRLGVRPRPVESPPTLERGGLSNIEA